MPISGVSGSPYPQNPINPSNEAKNLIFDLENAVISCIENIGKDAELIGLQDQMKLLTERLQSSPLHSSKQNEALQKSLERVKTLSLTDPSEMTADQLRDTLDSIKVLIKTL